jgi:hypothetical protein
MVAQGRCKLNAAVLEAIRDLVGRPSDCELWEDFSELFLGLALVVRKQADWAEGCHCHEHIWLAKQSAKNKKRQLQAEVGAAECPWKGCRAVEMQLERRTRFVEEMKAWSGTRYRL